MEKIIKSFLCLCLIVLFSINFCFASSVGVSPAKREVTVEQGKAIGANFVISGSLEFGEFIKISSEHEFIKTKNIVVSQTEEMVSIEISIPKETQIGVYHVPLIVCVASEKADTVELMGCVQAQIIINVVEAKKDYSVYIIAIYLLAGLLILLKSNKNQR